MFEKAGKYYADWRDASGKRLRKTFSNPRAALAYEAEQKELAHPKPRARAQQSPTYSAPRSSAPAPNRQRTTTKPPKRSSATLVPFRRKS